MGDAKLRVVVIDDSALSLELISAALAAAGFEVHTFTSVFEVTSTLESLKPHVIVVDLLMPAIGGDRVVDVVRRNAVHSCPVLLYSSAPEAELEQRARACGADGHVRKTQDLGNLVRAVHHHAHATKHVGT